MIKCISTPRSAKLVIIKDNKKILEMSMPRVFGYIDIDEFKHIETIYDEENNQYVVKVEV